MNKKRVFRLGGVLGAGLLASSATLAQPALPGGSWSIRYGMEDHLHRLAVEYQTPPWWTTQLWGKRLDLVGEFELAYWHSTHRSGRDAVQLGLTPMFQWWLGERLYLEAGIGAAVFSSNRVGDRRLGSALLFADHLGVGYQLNDAVRISLRASHFSNAGLASPNHGVNVFELGLTARW